MNSKLLKKAFKIIRLSIIVVVLLIAETSSKKYENKIVINLPKPYVIVLEESRDVPDKYEFIMRLD